MLALIIISFFAILILFAGIFKMNHLVFLLGLNGIALSAIALCFYDDNLLSISNSMFVCQGTTKFYTLLLLLVVFLVLILSPFF